MKKSSKKINLLREYINYNCEGCNKDESVVGRLEPHRLRRGWENGDYHFRNVKMLCKKCHKNLGM